LSPSVASTRSSDGGSIHSGSVDELDVCFEGEYVVKPRLQTLVSDETASLTPPHIEVKVKNTFLSVSLNTTDKAPAPRRRSASAPPQHLSIIESDKMASRERLHISGLTSSNQELLLENIVTPENSPRIYQGGMSQESWPQVERSESSPVAPAEPVLHGMVPVLVPMGYVASLAPQVAPTPLQQQPMSQQCIQEKAASLQQVAKCAHLAAAALRAQVRMAARENSSARPAANRHQEQQKNSSTSLHPTSVMIRNLPLDLTRDMLLSTLDREGFEGQYDFVYLPRDFGTGANLGYAFVNLLEHNEALRMQQHFNGFQKWSIKSAKKCAVVWGSMQGGCAYIQKYRSLAMNESIPEDCKPVFLRNGVKAVFPGSKGRTGGASKASGPAQ